MTRFGVVRGALLAARPWRAGPCDPRFRIPSRALPSVYSWKKRVLLAVVLSFIVCTAIMRLSHHRGPRRGQRRSAVVSQPPLSRLAEPPLRPSKWPLRQPPQHARYGSSERKRRRTDAGSGVFSSRARSSHLPLKRTFSGQSRSKSRPRNVPVRCALSRSHRRRVASAPIRSALYSRRER